jgi:TolB-like protein
VRGDTLARLSEFVTELKRRRVFRALIGWGIFSFAVLQVFEPVMHGLHLPEWTLSAVVVGLAAGFPATMVLAWIFDLGPSGIERTAPAVSDGNGEGKPRFGRKRLVAVLVLIGVAAAAPGLAWWFLWRGRPATASPQGPAPAAPGAPSVAVLPLVNISGDPGQDYFGDGITEEITSKLSRLRSLTVTARTSAAKYKGSAKSAREIGGELGVAYLVEGTVRRAGDRVRVNASLVRTSDAVQVWSEDQDARIDDIFAVQDRLAARIVEALGLKLSPIEASALANWGTRNARAYDEFLKGQARYADGADDPTVLKEAIDHLEKALAIDPDFAPALGVLAQATALGYRDFDSSPAVLARADSLASRAMALDPQLPGALKAAGDVRANRFDYVGAAPLYRKVVEATPRDHVAWDQLCWALGYAGPPHLEEAEQACRKALALQPQYFPSHYHMLRVHVQQGRTAEAEADLAALRAATTAPLVNAGAYWVAMAAGRPGDALAALRPDSTTNLNQAWQAMAIAQLGDLDRAFAMLERALAGGYADAADLRGTRFWAPLRADPRWEATLRRHGLAP